jgi:nicotinate-nucleotide adenylyltransferase
MESKRIGLYFGSFNPVHNGHLMIGNYLAEYGELDQVWFVISPLNPFKDEKSLLPDYHRRELLTRAIGDYAKFRVSSVEFKLPKPSYTIDTLEYLTKEYPSYVFSLIMGSDQLPDFQRWKNPEKILENFRILVYPRAGDQQVPFTHPSIQLVDAPEIEISSSFIRKAISEKKDVRFYMPPLTWQYLDEMHFYRTVR